MKILLKDLGRRKFPNLALMHISTDEKSKGNSVFLDRCDNPDKVYISCPFSNQNGKVNYLLGRYPNTVIGGYGYNDIKLPNHIEHNKPDYDLYGIDYSMGYTSRGCIRKCPWCVIPQMEGMVYNHAPISEFWDESHKKIILLDGNFLSSPKWYENMLFLRDNELYINFNAGLDIRLVNEDNANLLADLKYRNWTFNRTDIQFAFDTMPIEHILIPKIQILEGAGIKRYQLMFYVLVGYDTTFEQDYRRFELLRDLGIDPYIMVYNQKDDWLLQHFKRWVNRRIYKGCPNFWDYDKIKRLRNVVRLDEYMEGDIESVMHRVKPDSL